MYHRTAVLLHDVLNPVDLGSVCRAMANTGFCQLHYSGPLTGNEDDARRFALHARAILDGAGRHPTTASLVQSAEQLFGFSTEGPDLLTLDQGHGAFATALQGRDAIGLLFTNDKATLAQCHHRIALPPAGIGLAQTVLVVLWELRRLHDAAHLPQVPEAPAPISADELTSLQSNFRRYLESIDFLDPPGWDEVAPLFGSRIWSKRELTLLHALFGKGRSRYLAALRKAEK